jgi:type II secretory pathway pseudopilin PulG
VKAVAATRDEGGFTLVELLIVIVIESLIVGALGSAFILVTNNSSQVKESLARSGDARIAAAYIVSDARNSSGPETSLADTASCPDPSPPVSGTPTAVVRFNWNTTTSVGATTPNIVNYVLVSNALLRRQCRNGTLVTDRAVANNVTSVTVACAPTANCSGTPTTITATITETPELAGGPSFQYSLTGAFRKALAIGSALPGPTNPVNLVELGASGCGSASTGITISGGSTRVYGDNYINTADGSTCKAMNISSATYKAGGTKILYGGSCLAGSGGVCPSTSSYSPAIADPYAGLIAPSTAGMTSRSGCPSGAALPGVYASTLTISSSCTLASGIYVLQAGLSITAGTVTSAAGGVLLYITGGSVSVSGGSTSVTLAAMASGTYTGMVAWQAAADTSTITFSNNGQLSFAGAMYAPKAQLNHSTTSANHAVTKLVAQNIVNSSGALAIGTPSSTPLSFSGSAAPTAWTVNRPYPTTSLTPAGGDGNYIWSITGLATGLAFDTSTGSISGTPTATGSYSGNVTLNDLLGDTAYSVPYTLTINAAPSITTTSPLPAGSRLNAYSTTLVVSGGTTAYGWSATGLPAGLALNTSTGVISGTPTTVGTSTIAVTLTDAAGATATKSLSLTINAVSTSISSVTLANGGTTAGQLEKDDTISIVFSVQMSVSSFCSAWSGDTSDQVINANNNVIVTVTDANGGQNDSLTVTSASCTFRFGSVNLGSSAYVSGGNATFSGTGASRSTITWTAATHTLTITLGAATGTFATVASSKPIYTALPTMTDSSGLSVSNSPFTLATANQF